MNRSILPIVVPTLLIFAIVIACGRGSATRSGLSDADVAATVNAAVAATTSAEAAMQAATDGAAQPTATPTLVVVATSTPAPDPRDPPAPAVDTSTMSEQELTAAIDAAVAEAVAAAGDVAAATTAAATDGSVTTEEAVTVEVVLSGAEEAIALAEALISAYDQTYGAYATEALDTLDAIENELEAIAESTREVAEILEQEGEATTAAIEQIQAAASAASATADQLQTRLQDWGETLEIERGNRTATAIATQPSHIAADRPEAIQNAFDYIETVRAGLADGAISSGELTDIAQKGANASAGIRAHGGPQFNGVADSIDGVTGQIARGELPQAQRDLTMLESALPGRR